MRHRKLKGDVTDPRVVKLAKFAFSKLGCKFALGPRVASVIRGIHPLKTFAFSF